MKLDHLHFRVNSLPIITLTLILYTYCFVQRMLATTAPENWLVDEKQKIGQKFFGDANNQQYLFNASPFAVNNNHLATGETSETFIYF